FTEGEQLAIELTNGTARVVYINLLFLDANGSIYAVYPPPGGEGALRAGQPVSIGNHASQALTLRFPKDLALTEDDKGQPVQEVPDYMKLLVTTQPLDARALLQSALTPGISSKAAVHRGARSPHELAKLLNSALSGTAATRTLEMERQPAEDWLALTKTLRL